MRIARSCQACGRERAPREAAWPGTQRTGGRQVAAPTCRSCLQWHSARQNGRFRKWKGLSVPGPPLRAVTCTPRQHSGPHASAPPGRSAARPGGADTQLHMARARCAARSARGPASQRTLVRAARLLDSRVERYREYTGRLRGPHQPAARDWLERQERGRMRGASGKPWARQRRTVCEDHAGTRSALRALSPSGVARRSASRTPRGAAAPVALTDFHGPPCGSDCGQSGELPSVPGRARCGCCAACTKSRPAAQ